MRIAFLFLLISNLAFGQLKCCFNTVTQRQAAWDAIAALADLGHGPVTTGGAGGYFKETTLTNQCVSGDVCLGLRSFGSNKPNIHNLPFAGTQSITPSNGLLWFKDYAVNPQYIDYGQFDKFLRFFNGPPNVAYYETNPGSVSPNITQPLDLIIGIRYYPHTPDEGVNRIKPMGSTVATEHLVVFDGYSPDITLANGVTLPYYTDCVLRVLVLGDNTWQVWVNGVSQGTGTGVAFSTNEWIYGTNSHAMYCHIRYQIAKFGQFSTNDIATIYANSQTIWPWTKPSYPLITELYYGDNSTWDGTAKSWRAGRGHTPVFSGGTGTAGTHKYVWYWFDSGDATLFPSGDGVLTNHRQIPASVNISTIAAGNSVSTISIDGVTLCSPCGTYATSATATADAIVTLVNGNQTQYLAERRTTATILFHPIGLGCNNYHTNAVTITASGFSPTKIDAPRSQDLVRTTYAVTGQVFDGHAGDNVMKVACIVYPFDSAGAAGEPLPTRWIPDNIP